MTDGLKVIASWLLMGIRPFQVTPTPQTIIIDVVREA